MGSAELLILATICLCPLLVGGLIVWIWQNSKKAQSAPSLVPAAAAHLHVSVLALSFDASFRAQVEAALAAPTTSPDVTGQRVELVQRACRALVAVEPQWRAFGYGEKDLGDLTATRDSYVKALEDFRARSGGPSDGGNSVVLSVIIATRTPLAGVDRLDTRAQVHAVLEHRAQLDRGRLLGADVVWSPPEGGLTDAGLQVRFPEMHPLLG